MVAIGKIFKGIFNNVKKQKEAISPLVNNLHIKVPGVNTEVIYLSGGNQQKVLIARWLLTEPDILILDEPTRGIDIGAKFEIYKLMTDMVKEGKAIIMVSSELPELIGMCDRIYVMNKGHISGMLNRDEFSQEDIMRYATGL